MAPTPPTPAANGNWFYNKHTGQIQHITNWLEKMYFEANGGTYVSFNTQAEALAFKQLYEAHKTNPAAPNPDKTWWLNTSDGTITHDPGADLKPPWMGFATQAQAQAYLKAHPAPNPLQQAAGAVSSVASDALKPLFQANLWIRVVEVGLGLVLIAVGVAKLTNALPAATKIARMVA